MIDIFTIALSHGLILLAAWRLLFRDDLDHEVSPADAPERPWLKKQSAARNQGGHKDNDSAADA